MWIGHYPLASSLMADYIDADTVTVALAPSALEEHQRYDVGTVSFKLTPTGVEQRISTDAATITVAFSPSGVDVQTRFAPVFSVFTKKKWSTTLVAPKFKRIGRAQKKWQVEFFGKASNV